MSHQLVNHWQSKATVTQLCNLLDISRAGYYAVKHRSKMERVWQRDYANQMEATKDIVDYIVGFYNCQRLHSTLGYTSPINYEQEMAAKQPSGVSEIC